MHIDMILQLHNNNNNNNKKLSIIKYKLECLSLSKMRQRHLFSQFDFLIFF